MKVVAAWALIVVAGCDTPAAIEPACAPFVLGNTVRVEDAGLDGAPPCPENPLASEAGVYAEGLDCLPYCAIAIGSAALGCRLLPVCGGKNPVRGAVCVGCQ